MPNQTRRRFLSSLAAPALIAGIAPRRAWSSTDVDVVVIGGGLSGLSAALTLEGNGVSAQVIEADSRLGGRCFTMDTPEGNFDCGATTIGPYYGLIRSWVDQSGTELTGPHGRDTFSYHINGKFVPREDWVSSDANTLPEAERALWPEAMEFAFVREHSVIEDIFDWRTEETLKADIPLSTFLRSKGYSDEALRLIEITSNTMSLDNTSALFQMREFDRLALPQKGGDNREVYAAGTGGQYHYVKGGTSRLIEGMAGLLKSEARVNSPVTAIDIEKDGVTVRTADGNTTRARYAICTIPYSTLKKVVITPTLSGAKGDAVAASSYTLTSHVFCVPTEPYWEADGAPAGLISDDMIERVFANRNDDGEISWLDVWINGEAAANFDKMPEADAKAHTVKRLGELRPSMKGKIKAVGYYSWGNNPYVGGNKQVLGPGQVRDIYPQLAEPWQSRLMFAGEHTRDYEAGMEAAAQSGFREAINVLDRIT